MLRETAETQEIDIPSSAPRGKTVAEALAESIQEQSGGGGGVDFDDTAPLENTVPDEDISTLSSPEPEDTEELAGQVHDETGEDTQPQEEDFLSSEEREEYDSLPLQRKERFLQGKQDSLNKTFNETAELRKELKAEKEQLQQLLMFKQQYDVSPVPTLQALAAQNGMQLVPMGQQATPTPGSNGPQPQEAPQPGIATRAFTEVLEREGLGHMAAQLAPALKAYEEHLGGGGGAQSEKIQQLEQRLNAREQQSLQAELQSAGVQMDQKYGPEWRKHSAQMDAIASTKWLKGDGMSYFEHWDGIYQMIKGPQEASKAAAKGASRAIEKINKNAKSGATLPAAKGVSSTRVAEKRPKGLGPTELLKWAWDSSQRELR
jgi:hypothetical protein